MTENTPGAGTSADQSEWTVPALAVLAFLDGDQKIAEAEKRGAVEALRGYADVVEHGPRLTRTEEVADMRSVADRIESGEAHA